MRQCLPGCVFHLPTTGCDFPCVLTCVRVHVCVCGRALSSGPDDRVIQSATKKFSRLCGREWGRAPEQLVTAFRAEVPRKRDIQIFSHLSPRKVAHSSLCHLSRKSQICHLFSR